MELFSKILFYFTALFFFLFPWILSLGVFFQDGESCKGGWRSSAVKRGASSAYACVCVRRYFDDFSSTDATSLRYLETLRRARLVLHRTTPCAGSAINPTFSRYERASQIHTHKKGKIHVTI